MSGKNRRISREGKTIEKMIRLYCRKLHRTGRYLCDDCNGLLTYARLRLYNCPFNEGKTTCAKCPVHCYKPDMREKIRKVMRYSGPRMMYRHPILSIYHLIDKKREKPIEKENRKTGLF